MNLTHHLSTLADSHNPVKLVPPALHYVDTLYQAIMSSSPNHFQFLDWAHYGVTKTSVIENMHTAIDNFINDKNEYRFMIIHANSEEFIGCIGLLIREVKIPFYEIGYWIKTSSTGQGYTTHAVNLLTRFATEQLQAKRIEIKAAGRNIKSQNVALRCHFTFEARLKYHRVNPDGGMDDTLIFSRIS